MWALTLLSKLAERVLPAIPLWVAACLLCFVIGGYGGYRYERSNAEAERLAAVRNTIRQAAATTAQDQEVFDDAAKHDVEIEVRYREIFRRIPDIRADTCADLGPQFGRLYVDAINAARPPD